MRAYLLAAAAIMAALTGVRAVAEPALAPAPLPARDEVAKLIRELGDDNWRVREAATQRLRQIGLPAMPALRQALMSADLEVKCRSELLLDELARKVEDTLAESRVKVQEAFQKADYPRAAELARKITQLEQARMLDWLWQGHCCQLNGDWAGAVEGYRKVVTFIDADLKSGLRIPERPLVNQDPPPPPVPPPGGELVGPGNGKGPVAVPVAPGGLQPLNDRERTELVRQRTLLMRWIARMQRVELKAPAQAAKTLSEALDYLEAAKIALDDGWLTITIADEYPLCLHEAGDLSAAVEAWRRMVAWRGKLDRLKTDTRLVDVDRIFAGLRALPADAKPPAVPWILPLPPDGAETKLDLDDASTRDRAYQRGVYAHYALAPPPGKEFESIEFVCDIEQANSRFGGQFSCFVAGTVPAGFKKDLGSIGWPREKSQKGEVGREVVRKTIAIPAGAGLAHIRIGTPRKEFVVHSVAAKATYRPITADAPPICGDAWAQMDLYPQEGRLTWGKMTLRNQTAISGLATGRDVLRFSVPGDKRTIETPFEVKPGKRYGLFMNLDSPFKWRQLDLDLANDVGALESGLSIQRVGKEFVAIWCALDGRLLSARSADLVQWSRPEALPFSSVFANTAPGTFLAVDGTLWLAYFSNRLALLTGTTAGYHLWLTHTRDGKTWAPPRKIDMRTVSGWPLNPPVMLTDQAGLKWIFCRNYAASAGALATLDQITELQPFSLPVPAGWAEGKELSMCNFQVACEGESGFRMVFDDFGTGIYTVTSKNGLSWDAPRLLVKEDPDKTAGRSGQLSHPHLISSGGRRMLLYCWGSATFLTPVDLEGEPVTAGQGVRISGHLVSLAGRTPLVHDGKVFLIADGSTTWLLEADLKALRAVPAPAPATQPAGENALQSSGPIP